MPATNDSALTLAAHLRQLPDEHLAALLQAREIRESSIKDFFDLAEALLDPESVQHALGRLDRPTLATLAAISRSRAIVSADAPNSATALGTGARGLDNRLAQAARLALVAERHGVYEVPASVSERLAAWPAEGLPSPEELAVTAAPVALAAVSDIDSLLTDALAAERAFVTTASIADLLAELQHESARELARGGVALPDSKRLAAAVGVDLNRVPEFLEIAERAGLIALDSGHWLPTASSTDWMVGSSGERWSLLAAAWLERLPSDIRDILRSRAGAAWGDRLDQYAAWLYPAGGDWMRERLLVYTRDAELLGITANHAPSTPGGKLLAHGTAAAAAAMTALFPAEIERVYLQHDLSIVSPGPLAPRLDARLRLMADVEGRGLAASYRVSTASIYRAMASGETAASITEFFEQIALTGIPQPLAYLLSEAAARYGLVRVGALEDGSARSYVRSTDATLLRTLLVDHAIAGFGLTRIGMPGAERLVSRFDLDQVFWALSEARYPVAAENSSGEIVLLRRRRPVRAAAPTAGRSALTLIEKLRLGSSADPETTGKAWLSRQLDVAIKTRAAVTVTVQLPNGTAVDYQLEPSSVAGGRLRARDRRADIERTLPVASITNVAPVG